MGGSKENRHTPGLDHWSLAVKDGKALEKQWRTEVPIPRGGPHRLAYCLDSASYMLISIWTHTKYMYFPFVI